MGLADFARLPALEAREWERFAVRGPGELQTLILLATIGAMISRALGGNLTPRALMPWLSGLDPTAAVEARREATGAEIARRRMQRALGAAAPPEEASDGR